jgi:hypothetical protein
MQDRDPASLLFVPRDEYRPLQLDPELFESVGGGVSQRTFIIPEAPLKTPAKPSHVSESDPLDRLKSLAAILDPQEGDKPDNSSDTRGGGAECKGSQRIRMGTAQSWESAWEQELDQRVLDIDQYNIFDKFCDLGTSSVLFPGNQPVQPSSSLFLSGLRAPQDVDLDREWRKLAVVDATSHPAGLALSPSVTKDTLALSFDLPALAKRPRSILNDCLLRDQVPRAIGKTNRHQQRDQEFRAPKVAKTQSLTRKVDNQKEDRAETWRAAGKPVQDDLTETHRGVNAKERLIQEQLSWETCAKGGPRIVSSHLVMSPYVTEAGTSTFESVYQR